MILYAIHTQQSIKKLHYGITMVVFLFALILLLIITFCQIITLVESSKRKRNDKQHVKTVTSKFTALGIKQRTYMYTAVINTKHFNNTKFKIFQAEFKN